MVLRLLVSLVPEFRSDAGGDPSDTANGTQAENQTTVAIRDFISMDILQACITSFHEPYFVELQKDLASLIAAILVNYSPITSKPREVIMSLPNINPAGLERLTPYMAKPGVHTRQQRAIVQDLLKDLKGVSVSEMGKLPKSTGLGSTVGRRAGGRSQMAQQFMQTNNENGTGVTRGMVAGERKATPDGLDGVSNLFELDSR
jgi:exportin-5